MKVCSECRHLCTNDELNFCPRCKGCLEQARDMVCITCGKQSFLTPCYDCKYPKTITQESKPNV